MIRTLVLIAFVSWSLPLPVAALELVETPSLESLVYDGSLPPVTERVPTEPAVVDLVAQGRELGLHGGTLNMIMGGVKDTRQLVVYGYARLVTYEPGTFELKPDILKAVEVEGDRVFTFTLRDGHRWSDGHPFTAEDFRYWWEHVANHAKLSPSGPPSELIIDGEAPRFEVLSPTKVRYSWSRPNPGFLPSLAGARPLYLYRPAHYLKEFHEDFADPEELAGWVEAAHQNNWAALHNKFDNLYKSDNPDLPTLQPWLVETRPPAERFSFRRNPFYHRIDTAGRQLPYIDQVIFQIAAKGLIPAKTGTGEADLQARYLSFDDYTFLRQSEARGDYETYLWRTAKGSHVALYPNLNAKDPVWRDLMRDVRFRRALSLAVDRHEINQVIYFGLAMEGANTVLPDSPLSKPEFRRRWTQLDSAKANRLLDAIGLTKRDSRGVRLLPDGRPAEIIVETAGESTEQTDVLELLHDAWMRIGIKIYTRPSQRTVFRNRIFAGATIMSIWSGVENGLATAETSPDEFAPTDQTQYMWPKWGQHYQTQGRAGEAPDLPEAKRLLALYHEWRFAEGRARRRAIWGEMLDIWSEQVYSIGLVSGVLQPVVVSLNLHNVPVKATYNWDPGAHFGMYRPDTFFFGPKRTPVADAVLRAAAFGE
ncbi:MAG: ABC transporter substrate-binding protein [Alphaproteobacteria bacterium]|nr:ABC transporter substrate-binding protein [Alphaproteobacteria bacterium]